MHYQGSLMVFFGLGQLLSLDVKALQAEQSLASAEQQSVF